MEKNSFNSNMIEVIMNKMVEESKDVMTDPAYNEGINFITDIFRSSGEDMNRLKYSYNSGFYQGKYSMRRKMLMLFEDTLNTVLQIIEEGDDNGKET